MKWVIILTFTIFYLLLAFFGLGPVLFADGSMEERVITLAIILLLTVCITIIFRVILKKIK
ncbi:DUF6954 family protein [Bacillus sp. AK128]